MADHFSSYCTSFCDCWIKGVRGYFPFSPSGISRPADHGFIFSLSQPTGVARLRPCSETKIQEFTMHLAKECLLLNQSASCFNKFNNSSACSLSRTLLILSCLFFLFKMMGSEVVLNQMETMRHSAAHPPFSYRRRGGKKKKVRPHGLR